MPSLELDPYAVLGVSKDATVADIKAAHRKLVLKCHPDKIQDEALQNQARDEFQKVQQSYEILSDATSRQKYDMKVYLAELRSKVSATPPRPSYPREYRGDQLYEERAPAADPDSHDDDLFYADEQRASSRKYDDNGRRSRTKLGVDEKGRTKTTPLSAAQAAREKVARESSKAGHSDRAKTRTKERRRDVTEKYERYAPEEIVVEDDDDGRRHHHHHHHRSSSSKLDDSDSDSGSDRSYYVRVKKPPRETSSRKPKSRSSGHRSPPPRFDEPEEYSDYESNKHEHLHTSARDYIMRSKGNPPIEINNRRPRSSHSPPPPPRYHSYDSTEPESTSRRSVRTPRSSRDNVRPSSSRQGSREHLEIPRVYEPKMPSMPTAATSPGLKVPSSSSSTRPPMPPSRSATTTYPSRPKREGSSRSDDPLYKMVYTDAAAPRSTKSRGPDRYDSEYSSSPTPDLHPSGGSPPKVSTRYKVVSGAERDVLVESDLPKPTSSSSSSSAARHSRGYSPTRHERSSASSRPMPKPVRSSTAPIYPHDSYRPSSNSSSSKTAAYSSKPETEREYLSRLKDKGTGYIAREVGPNGVVYSRDPHYPRQYDDPHHPPTHRRQMTFA
ncbi:hypothetical protein ASPZODRAFT_15051 [Penicilliopsis zonata CBS 506.65]|uniref:J domain-containing protein n=1 Tax=Penicilliopsis zonata CBS 506.65 TaxID=1073090 RepID=A0A1L9SK62_9EURO|nr:hypothetical protein ASPZODRAFT_15051 [Penicilliopsis zonata CBS 506.65]OJJ47600.1 hypothetical protein ASPZODRAFT_15051 [Penicilliopsis zonata CBS 506.65]